MAPLVASAYLCSLSIRPRSVSILRERKTVRNQINKMIMALLMISSKLSAEPQEINKPITTKKLVKIAIKYKILTFLLHDAKTRIPMYKTPVARPLGEKISVKKMPARRKKERIVT